MPEEEEVMGTLLNNGWEHKPIFYIFRQSGMSPPIIDEKVFKKRRGSLEE